MNKQHTYTQEMIKFQQKLNISNSWNQIGLSVLNNAFRFKDGKQQKNVMVFNIVEVIYPTITYTT